MNKFVCKSVFFVFVSFCSRKKKKIYCICEKKKVFFRRKGFCVQKSAFFADVSVVL